MKKIIVTLLLLLLALSLLAGCTKKQSTTDSSLSTPDGQTSLSESESGSDETSNFPSDGKLTVTKEGTSVKGTLSIPSMSGRICSLLLLPDLSYQFSWGEQPQERLCDLAEITLDEKGDGTFTLNTNGFDGSVYLVVTTDDGAFTTAEIK